MDAQTITRWTNRISVGAVLLIALFAFILSYNALYDLSRNHLPSDNPNGSGLAYIWPLLIDLALVVFSGAVLRAYLLKEKAVWPWSLVALFTLGTIVFNLAHADREFTALDIFGLSIDLKYLVNIVPPVALVLSFETLMAMVRNNVQRSSTLESLADLSQKLIEKERELDNLIREKLAELDSQTAGRQLDLDSLQEQLDIRQAQIQTIQGETDRARAELLDINGQVEAKKKELETAGVRPVIIIGDNDPRTMKPAERQKYIAQLLAGGIDEPAILETFGISPKTFSRDKEALNLNGKH